MLFKAASLGLWCFLTIATGLNLSPGTRKNFLQANHKHSSSDSSSSRGDTFCQHNLLLDSGFYEFRFGIGNGGFFSYDSFFFVVNQEDGALITVTDCFCAGDKFLVYDNGLPLFGVNGPCDDSHCQTFETSPFTCMNNLNFCSGQYTLSTGPHNITIMSAVSPYNGGSGFITVQALNSEPNLLCEVNNSCNYSIHHDRSCVQDE